jgi:cysteinyl-tRNA synthetase
VLFAVGTMQRYGALSGRSLDEMVAGARVEVAPYKRDPMDFVLWKPSADSDPGWDSPWGRGRPGWHIECSAMAAAHLGETFDIHGGGIDLVFPHHENEIAQSTCAHGTPIMAQVWMHNGFLQVEGQKMSKSLGNFVTIRELLNDWPGEVIRLNMLKTHYRQPIDWTVKGLESTAATVDDWYWAASETTDAVPTRAIEDALKDDLNTHQAITELHAIRKRVVHGSSKEADELAASLNFLGFNRKSVLASQERRRNSVLKDVSKIEDLVEARLAARRAKNFAEADRIRDELVAMDVVLKDAPDGTTIWE